VTFLATWCFPCLVDLPALERLQLEHGSTGFQNIAVGMDLEGKTMLEPFARQYALSYPLMVASAPLLAGQTPVGRIRELPTRVLFGGDGQVLGAYAGLLPWSTLQHAVIEALRARTSAQRSAGGSRQGR
jgi:hypothetical protein